MKFRGDKFTPGQNFNDRYPTLGTHSNRSRTAIRGKPRMAKLALRTVSCIGKVNYQSQETDIFGIFAITSFGKVLKIGGFFLSRFQSYEKS